MKEEEKNSNKQTNEIKLRIRLNSTFTYIDTLTWRDNFYGPTTFPMNFIFMCELLGAQVLTMEPIERYISL